MSKDGPADDTDADAQESAHAHSHSHPHSHSQGDEDDGEPPSTGFLPMSLALALFVTGLFVLGILKIPGC